MTISHHPDHATLMSFAAGSLGEALSAVVATHAELCAPCRRTLARMDAIGAALLAGLAGAATAERAPSGQQHRSDPEPAPFPGLPGPLARLVGRPLEEIRWTPISPGAGTLKLPLSAGADGDLRLVRVRPGSALPEHGHGGAELTLVLRGCYRDLMGRFAPGDVADLDAEVEHKPVAEGAEDCVCLVASEQPVKLRGLVGRILQPLVRM